MGILIVEPVESQHIGALSPASAEWGLLANAGAAGQAVKGVYFFAGSARSPQPHSSEIPAPTPNTQLYTLTPLDDRDLGWGQDAEYRERAVRMIADSGANVVVLSAWGAPTSDRWRFWAPMESSPEANDQLFDLAGAYNMFVLPAIESSDGTLGCGGSTPAYHFAADFPGPPDAPAPQLVEQIVALVERYITQPRNPQWPRQWAQLRNRAGEARYAIHLLHVASRQLAPYEHQRFAAAFDAVADTVFGRTGVWVGFTLDIIPRSRIGFGEQCATTPPALFRDSYLLTPAGGRYLRQLTSLLGVQGFIPEIYLRSSDSAKLLSFKRRYLQGWIDQGLPVMLDASPGYDARQVFRSSPHYGHSEAWRAGVGALYELGCRGVVFNTWNGYTEGYAAVPTREYGDTEYRWLQSLFQRVDQDMQGQGG